MSSQVKVGFIHGTGSAENVELGWIPDYVKIVNLTDGDKIHENWLHKVIAFTSGSVEIEAGDTLKGITSGAYATVKQVILDSGTWAGGDAAGWIVLEHEGQSGTFEAENGGQVAKVGDTPDNELTLTAAADQDGIDIDTEVAGTTTDATNVKAYVGSAASNAKGFTVGSTISENGKLLGFIALRSGPGESDIDQASTVW